MIELESDNNIDPSLLFLIFQDTRVWNSVFSIYVASKQSERENASEAGIKSII